MVVGHCVLLFSLLFICFLLFFFLLFFLLLVGAAVVLVASDQPLLLVQRLQHRRQASWTTLQPWRVKRWVRCATQSVCGVTGMQLRACGTQLMGTGVSTACVANCVSACGRTESGDPQSSDGG